MEDIVPETPNLKDLISMSEAAELQGCSFEEIEDLIKQGRLSSHEINGQRLFDRKEIENVQPKSGGNL